MRSLGLIPFSDLSKLVQFIGDFTPVYEKLIYEPNKEAFEKQLKDIEGLLAAKNIAGYFEQAKIFYRSAWVNSVPFVLTFYPLPGSTGFRATAFSNIVLIPLHTSWTDYNLILGLQIHEMAHILCDEQELPVKLEMENWFTSNPSMYSRYAKGLLQENGRKIRTLNIIDDYNREALAMEVSFSFPAERVIEVLMQCIEWRKTKKDQI